MKSSTVIKIKSDEIKWRRQINGKIFYAHGLEEWICF